MGETTMSNLISTSLLLFMLYQGAVSFPLTGCDVVLGKLCYWQPTTTLLNNIDAQNTCAADKGRLPIFSTASDYNSFLKYKNVTSSTKGVSIWLGYWNYNAHSASAPGIWTDKNGTGLSGYYTKWGPGQPNDSVTVGGEKCSDIDTAIVNMNDCDCGQNLAVVCQENLASCSHCEVVGSACLLDMSTSATNAEALSFCISIGAKLPDFPTTADFNNLVNWRNTAGVDKFWVGYWNPKKHYSYSPGNWTTQNGSLKAGSSFKWNTGEPNNGGSYSSNETCVEVNTLANDNVCGYAEPNTICQCAVPSPPTTTLTCANCNWFGSKCYLTITAIGTNNQSKMLCAGAGGVLPTFQSQTDLNSFTQYWYTQQSGDSGVWVGYWNSANHSAVAPGVWLDQNGVATTFAGWASGQPDNMASRENCAQTGGITTGSFNDINCNTLATPIICDCTSKTTSTTNTAVTTTSTISTAISAPTTSSASVMSTTTSTPTTSLTSLIPTTSTTATSAPTSTPLINTATLASTLTSTLMPSSATSDVSLSASPVTETTTMAYSEGTTIQQQSSKPKDRLPVVIALLSTAAVLLCVCCVVASVLCKRKWNENEKRKSAAIQTG